MVEPVTGHPAADRATPEALVVEQDRRVVALSTWIADAAVQAVGTGRVLQVLTPPQSRVTYPLELLLRDCGGQWVVREGRERFRDALTGIRLCWSGARFVTAPDAAASVAADVVADVAAVAAGSGDLEVQVSARHEATESLELGGTTVAVWRALTGVAPAGFGTAEPATQPWSRREVSGFCRERAPAPTQLVVVGGGLVGQLMVERVRTGVAERIRVSGPPAGAVDRAAIESLAAELAGSAQSMIVAAHPGRCDGLRIATPAPPALPYGMLAGPPVVAARGLPHARSAPARCTVLGDAARPACWYRLDTGPGRPYELLTSLLRHFGLPETLDPEPG